MMSRRNVALAILPSVLALGVIITGCATESVSSPTPTVTHTKVRVAPVTVPSFPGLGVTCQTDTSSHCEPADPIVIPDIDGHKDCHVVMRNVAGDSDAVCSDGTVHPS